MVAEEELIMICIDNSVYMRMFAYSRCSFRLQLEAIRLYCQAKFKSNPKTAIGLMGMGTLQKGFWLHPTSDLDNILFHLSNVCLKRGGELDFFAGMTHSLACLTAEHQPSKPKRMLIFTGGPIFNAPEVAEAYGKLFKELGVAFDVVNFTLEKGSTDSKKLIESFVTAANKNGNLKHVPPEPSTCISRYLSSPPAIIPCALIEDGEIVAVAAKNKKAEDYKRKRKNQAAAARNKKAEGYNRENQAAAHDDEYLTALGIRNAFGTHLNHYR